MAFISGTINAGGFLACHKFVTHVTGFATLFGIDAVSQNWDHAIGLLSVPLFFILGAMIAAYFIDRRYLLNKPPKYFYATGLISLCMFAAAIGGYYNYFGKFGEPANLTADYLLLCLTVMAAGLQNSAVTSSSGATVRTTHLTGVTTDVGIGIIRLSTLWGTPNEDFKREALLMWLRVGIIGAFVLGSLVGVVLFLKYEYLGFLLPATLALLETHVALKYKPLFEARHAWLRAEPFHHRH